MTLIRTVALALVAITMLAGCQTAPAGSAASTGSTFAQASLNEHCVEYKEDRFCFKLPNEWVGECKKDSSSCFFKHNAFVNPQSGDSVLELRVYVLARGHPFEKMAATIGKKFFDAYAKGLAEKGPFRGDGPCVSLSENRQPATTKDIASGDFVQFKEIGPRLNWKNIQMVDEYSCTANKPFVKSVLGIFLPEDIPFIFTVSAWFKPTQPDPDVYGSDMFGKIYRNLLVSIEG